MKKLAVLSGAGVSKESGINTFRDSDGMWEQYRVEEVASIEGWYRNLLQCPPPGHTDPAAQ